MDLDPFHSITSWDGESPLSLFKKSMQSLFLFAGLSSYNPLNPSVPILNHLLPSIFGKEGM
jgi:hypothetical protein